MRYRPINLSLLKHNKNSIYLLFFIFLPAFLQGQTTTILSENFSSGSGTTPPAGWTTNQNSGNANDLWAFNNPGSRTINAPVAGIFAIFDSDNNGSGGPTEDVSLESPSFDASPYTSINLNFDHYFNSGYSGRYTVEVFNGTTWTAVLDSTSPSTANAASEGIDITAEAGGAANAQVRFRWRGRWSWYWAIDNVVIIGKSPVVPIDTDGDTIADYLDQDDDNDGILDCVEKRLSNSSFDELFTINGDATQISTTELQVTPDNNDQAGSAFANDQIDFNQDFSFSFEVNLGNSNSGADGLAIVFHNDPDGSTAIGASGSGLAARGIQDGIVLEIDTHNNGSSGIGDIPHDHTMIWDSDNQSGIGLLTTAISFGNLEDGAWRTVTITWDASIQNISYTIDGTNAGSFTDDLVNNYFDGENLIYFGFTGSTGGSTNDQRIRFASGFCGFQVSIDDDNDGIENHLDLDSDNDGIYDGHEAGHGETLTAGRLTGPVGTNGYDDDVETVVDNNTPNYTIANTDGDALDDFTETDADNDGCYDTIEEDIADSDNDGIAGTGAPPVDLNGLVTSITYTIPPNNDWQNAASKPACDIDTDGDGIFNLVDDDDDNDGITDINELYCSIGSSTSATFDSATEAWQSTGATINAGSVYSLFPSGSSLGTNTVNGGPNDGEEVSVVQFAGNRYADLDGYGYYYADNSLESFLRASLPIGFANLTGTEYDYLLTFIGMIDVNGNGQYDVGVDQIVPRVFLENDLIRFTANVSGTFYVVFTDSNYGDNSGTFSFTVQECIPYDSDGDGIFDHLDPDSDDDGCPDVVEAGHTDANNDGVLDGTGFDASGLVTGATTSYTGNLAVVTDPLDNSACCDVTQSGMADNDGDNYADEICDLDDDNDGILDLDEMDCGVTPPGVIGIPIEVTGGTPVDTVYTNFGDFWKSSIVANNPILPNTTHEVLAFSAGGVTFTTGVPDDDVYDNDGNGLYELIDTNNDGVGDLAATESMWQAFSNNNDVTNKISLEGSLNDGDLSTALGLTVVGDPATDPLNPLLSNGVQGLDLGTGIANINESWFYNVDIISAASVNDGTPDILLTQVASPSGSTYQIFTFYDASWSPVGNSVRVESTGSGGIAPQIGTYRLDLYNGNGSIFDTNSTRPIRMSTLELSEFALDASNVGDVIFMSIEFSSSADVAFVGYNTSTFRGLCADLDTDSDGIPNRLDVDSDDDGCADAIEGAGSFNLGHLNPSDELNGLVDGNGVPVIASGGQNTSDAVLDDSDRSSCACSTVRTNRQISNTIKRE